VEQRNAYIRDLKLPEMSEGYEKVEEYFELNMPKRDRASECTIKGRE